MALFPGRFRIPATEAQGAKVKLMRIYGSNAAGQVANTPAPRRTASGGFSVDEGEAPQSAKPAASLRTIGGIDALLAAIEDRLAATRMTLDLSIDAADGAGISWLHRNAEVLNKELHDGRFDMTVRVDETKRDIVVNRFDAVPHTL